MKTLTFNIPENVDIDEKEISKMLAAQLYDLGKLSLGQAADLVGLTKEEFMNELGKYKVSLFGETLEDIERDLKNEDIMLGTMMDKVKTGKTVTKESILRKLKVK